MLPCDTTIVQDAFTKLSAAEIMKKTSSLAHVIDQRLFREYGGLSNVDQPIALLLQRNVKLIICILAIWRTGRAVLPISYDWPSARIIGWILFIFVMSPGYIFVFILCENANYYRFSQRVIKKHTIFYSEIGHFIILISNIKISCIDNNKIVFGFESPDMQ